MAEKIVESRYWPTLKLYSKGEWVVVLQALLNAKNNAKLDVDGEFGVFTYSAVNKFQNKCGLERDGIVGAKTWGALKK
jgi:peptidoglycan hydrolase-like protein with peptidoglycan-binding domain